MAIKKQPSCNDIFEEGAIAVTQAVDAILDKTTPLTDYQKVHIRIALNQILYRDIHSPVDVPAHTNSAMDGYALNSRNLPTDANRCYRVVGRAFAGSPFIGSCAADECVRIMTGAIMPDDTDTIVIQEHVQALEDGSIEIAPGHKQHQNVRFAGEDIRQGTVVLTRGTRVKPADLGVLASLGINECEVVRRPRVAFFSTGDELKSIGEPLGKGDIYDSNRYSLYGLLSRCDVEIIDMGVVRDKREAIRDALLSAARSADVILTSGGVSVGEADYIKDILQEIGSMDFWKIAMKPGRPLTSGKIGDSLFFGLPGNPVAVMVTFYQFVLPCLIKLAGLEYRPPMRLLARSVDAIRKNPGRREFQRAIVSNDGDGQLQVQLTGRQGSGILTSMSRANGFIVLDETCGRVEAGETVPVELFDHYYQ